MIIKEQKTIVFDNQCDCQFDSKILSDAIIWYFYPKFVYYKKRITLWRRYPAISAHGINVHVHRLLGMYLLLKEIVYGRTSNSIVIHHKDTNILNCYGENLEVKLFGKHISEHLKGTKFTIEHRRKIGEANRRRKGMKFKKSAKVPLGELKELLLKNDSINSISKHFGVDWSTIKNRIIDNPELIEGMK